MIHFDLRIFFKWVGSTTNRVPRTDTFKVLRVHGRISTLCDDYEVGETQPLGPWDPNVFLGDGFE